MDFDGKSKEKKGGRRGRACMVVLGDIGRNPRMQYHALSLANQASLEVDIVAYEGTSLMGSHLQNETLFTTEVGSNIYLKPNRPALVVSSTSWTPDEDFGILLEAALMYDRRVAAILHEDYSIDEEVIWKEISYGKQCLYPRLLFIIIGKFYPCIAQFANRATPNEFKNMLFKGFPDECDSLKVLKNGALETGSSARWATEWEEHAKPLITEASSFCFSM
ncbi:UDP-glycosyltransferase TURAN isoform X2 [Sesbania bispinosa]|nr:UDP-glycosyltransferase TURAN isoform X2 [Sesbania bispinosa]